MKKHITIDQNINENQNWNINIKAKNNNNNKWQKHTKLLKQTNFFFLKWIQISIYNRI